MREGNTGNCRGRQVLRRDLLADGEGSGGGRGLILASEKALSEFPSYEPGNGSSNCLDTQPTSSRAQK